MYPWTTGISLVVSNVVNQKYNQLVTIKLSVDKKGMASCHEGGSARLAMCLYLAVVTWEGSKALAFGGSRHVVSSLEATFIGE